MFRNAFVDKTTWLYILTTTTIKFSQIFFLQHLINVADTRQPSSFLNKQPSVNMFVCQRAMLYVNYMLTLFLIKVVNQNISAVSATFVVYQCEIAIFSFRTESAFTLVVGVVILIYFSYFRCSSWKSIQLSLVDWAHKCEIFGKPAPMTLNWLPHTCHTQHATQ